MNFDKLTKKLSSNESDFMRKFLVKIRKCKKIDPNTSKDLMITCVLHISPIKSINHSPPPWYSQYFSTFCYSREFPGNGREFPGIPDSREWKFCSRKLIPTRSWKKGKKTEKNRRENKLNFNDVEVFFAWPLGSFSGSHHDSKVHWWNSFNWKIMKSLTESLWKWFEREYFNSKLRSKIVWFTHY